LVASLFLLSFVINGMGFWLAWKLDSSPGFHTIMNMLLLPMWMASGSLFPTGDSGWLKTFMKINPFTYGIAGVRRGLFPGSDLGPIPSFTFCIVFLALAGILFYFFSSLIVARTAGKK
jgi:ABC-type polysaccharide/polyol phosphate export permease